MNSVCDSCHRLSGSAAQVEIPFHRETKTESQPVEQKRSLPIFNRNKNTPRKTTTIRENESVVLTLCENCISNICYDIVRERRLAILHVVPLVLDYASNELKKLGSEAYFSQQVEKDFRHSVQFWRSEIERLRGSDLFYHGPCSEQEVYRKSVEDVKNRFQELWSREKGRANLASAVKQLYSECRIPKMGGAPSIELWTHIWERLKADCQQILLQKDSALKEVAKREMDLLNTERDFVVALERGKFPISFFSIRKICSMLENDWTPGIPSPPTEGFTNTYYTYLMLDFGPVIPEIHEEWGFHKGGHSIQSELELFFSIYIPKWKPRIS